MDRRTFLKQLITFPKKNAKDKLVINSDVDIKGTVRIFTSNGSALLLAIPIQANYSPIVGPKGSTEPLKQSYQLTIGDKAHG